MNYAVILAGGHGTRLWPVSRKNSPKQAGYFFNNLSLLQMTYNRVLKIFPKENIFISCGIDQYDILKKQLKDLRKDNFIIEPEPRGTAMAIGFACISILSKDKDASIVMVNSDHFVANEIIYKKNILACLKAVKNNPEYISLIGISPSYPETGYGYIEIGKLFKSYDSMKFFNVKRFKEKPDLVTAKKYIKSKKFLWNPAWFVFRASTMLELFKKHLPEHFKSLNIIEQKICSKDFNKIIKEQFKKVDNISIDYGIMEKVKKMIVLPSNLKWRDIGSWDAVSDCFGQNGKSLIEGNVIEVDSSDNLVINKNNSKIVSLVGLNNMVVVDTEDALFICSKDKSQEVKKIISVLKKEKKYNKYL